MRMTRGRGGGNASFRMFTQMAQAGMRDRQRRERRGGRRDGSTMYDPSVRSGERPQGAYGEVNLHGETGAEGHSTQYYADGHRVSWDGDGRTDHGEHWTNDNVPKGKRNRVRRHTPPPDAQ